MITLDEASKTIKRWEQERTYRQIKVAAMISELLDDGYTQRQVAVAIGKSPAHVHFMCAAYKICQARAALDFSDAYKMAKVPKGRKES